MASAMVLPISESLFAETEATSEISSLSFISFEFFLISSTAISTALSIQVSSPANASCHFLQQLGTHVLIGIGQLDFLGYGYAILGNGRGAEFLIQQHIPSFRTQCDLNGLGDLLHTGQQLASRIFVEHQLFRHNFLSPLSLCRTVHTSSHANQRTAA